MMRPSYFNRWGGGKYGALLVIDMSCCQCTAKLLDYKNRTLAIALRCHRVVLGNSRAPKAETPRRSSMTFVSPKCNVRSPCR